MDDLNISTQATRFFALSLQQRSKVLQEINTTTAFSGNNLSISQESSASRVEISQTAKSNDTANKNADKAEKNTEEAEKSTDRAGNNTREVNQNASETERTQENQETDQNNPPAKEPEPKQTYSQDSAAQENSATPGNVNILA